MHVFNFMIVEEERKGGKGRKGEIAGNRVSYSAYIFVVLATLSHNVYVA